MCTGVPQNSTLFIIAVNDIFIANEVCIEKCLYGDDLVLFYSILSTAIIEHKLFQRALNKIIENAENKIRFFFLLSSKEKLC